MSNDKENRDGVRGEGGKTKEKDHMVISIKFEHYLPKVKSVVPIMYER